MMGGFKDFLRFIMGWYSGQSAAPPEPTCICVVWEQQTLSVSWDESINVPVLWDKDCDC